MPNDAKKVSRNPCQYCVASVSYKNRHYPNYTIECQRCEHNKAHKAYLESKRMFTAGEPITTMEELLQQEWVIWHGATKHIEMFRSMPVRTVEMFLKNGSLKKAIKKEKE